jgi:hypothetical protein
VGKLAYRQDFALAVLWWVPGVRNESGKGEPLATDGGFAVSLNTVGFYTMLFLEADDSKKQQP